MSARPAMHADAANRWQALTLVEQMAHVGSEVERTIRAHAAGNTDRREHALARALELFDLTAADARWRGPRRREVLRSREEFCRLFFADSPSLGSADGLRKYFLAFAVAARRTRIENPATRTAGEMRIAERRASPNLVSPIRLPDGTAQELLDAEREDR